MLYQQTQHTLLQLQSSSLINSKKNVCLRNRQYDPDRQFRHSTSISSGITPAQEGISYSKASFSQPWRLPLLPEGAGSAYVQCLCGIRCTSVCLPALPHASFLSVTSASRHPWWQSCGSCGTPWNPCSSSSPIRAWPSPACAPQIFPVYPRLR